MSPKGVIVVLTDDDPNLTLYADLLRQDGWRVLVTEHPYEAALFVAREPVLCLVARRSVLPDPVEAFLRRLLDLQERPFVVLTVSAAASGPASRPLSPLVDRQLSEPFLYSELLETLDYATRKARQRTPREVALAEVAPPPVDRPLFAPVATRLLACCRRLTELEHDREQLLTTGLEMFLDLVNGTRGSIMLLDGEEGTLRLVRRSGFPAGFQDPGPREVDRSPAGQVALSGEPLLVRQVTEPHRPGYRSSSYMVLPLRDQKVVLGVVNLTDRRGGEPFSSQDLEAAMALARQFAANVVNAGKFEGLSRMAVVDPLTGLFNRRYFDRQIAVELERARRFDRQVTLALLDIDNFKMINDIDGYVAGDRIIRRVGGLIRESFREVDIVTRWGGDEFAVLLPDTARPAAGPKSEPSVSYVDRVRRLVADEDFEKVIPGLTGRITLSAGVATFPADGRDRAGLFAGANLALQRAKRSGHNRVCLASEEPPESRRSAAAEA